MGASSYGRSGERLRTGAPASLAFASVLFGTVGVLLVAYGFLLAAFALLLNDDEGGGGSDLSVDEATGAAAFVGLLMLVVGVVYVLTAVGAAMGARWARPVGLVLAGLQVLGTVAMVVSGGAVALVGLVYPVVSGVLLLVPASKATFDKRPVAVAEIERPDL